MSIHPIAATALFTLLGVFIYFVDSQFGISLSRWWYNLTHKDPRPEGSRMGFIAGHKTRRKLIAGLIVGMLGFLLQMLYFDKPSLSIVLSEAASLMVGITLGFLIAPAILSFLPSKIEAATDYVDKVESGEIDVRDDLAGAATDISGKVKDAATGGMGKATDVFKGIKDEIKDIGENLEEGIKDFGDEVKDRTGLGGDRPSSSATAKKESDSAGKTTDGKGGQDGKDNKDWRKGIKKSLDK